MYMKNRIHFALAGIRFYNSVTQNSYQLYTPNG